MKTHLIASVSSLLITWAICALLVWAPSHAQVPPTPAAVIQRSQPVLKEKFQADPAPQEKDGIPVIELPPVIVRPSR